MASLPKTLPVDIVARLQEVGQELLAYAQTHRGVTLGDFEAVVREAMQAVLPEVLAGLVAVSVQGGTPGAMTRGQACPTCARRCPVQSWRPRHLATTCGPVSYERPWYHCRRCRAGFSPVDQRLGVPTGANVSAALQAWLAEAGARLPFRGGVTLLRRWTGLVVAPETARQHTAQVGQRLAEQETQAMAQVAQTGVAAEPVEPVPPTARLVVETDGAMARYRQRQARATTTGRWRYAVSWHEIKLGVVGLWDQSRSHPAAGARPGEPGGGRLVAQSYVAARETSTAFGPRLVAEAARRGALDVLGWVGGRTGRALAVLREVLVLGDGIPWIWELAASSFGTRLEILDYFHALDHLWQVARAGFGEGTPAAQAWVQQQAHALLDPQHGVATVRAALTVARFPATTPAAREALRLAQGYFRTHAHRMRYADYRAQGWPIGSGAVESCAKTLVEQRLKRPGAQWSPAGAHAVLTVRCRLLSHRPIAC
jgi:hypothetical protein